MKPKNRKSKKPEKPKEKIKRKKYDADSLQKALQAIQKGMSRKLAAKTYQVPRTTLIYHIQNPDHNSRPGPSTILTEKEENDLEEWINICCKKGFPKRKEDLINSVAGFLKQGKRVSSFKNGEKWFKLFMRRHPKISFRTPEAVSSASAAISETDVRGWFKQIENYLKENSLFNLLSDPSRVYNGDETNFLLCPKTGVVLAPKGSKNVYEVDNAQAKTSLTVMFTFGADGTTTPPMVIFPNKRLSANITSAVPKDWGIGLSSNGWMNSETFYGYIESVLYPHLVKKEIQFPILLFVDGHKSHLTYMVSELCTKFNIILIALYPNCTRILQPADVAAFKPLKYGWQKSVLEWRRTHPSEALTKASFVPLLEKTIRKWVLTGTIVNGFRATGLCPWNPDSIDFTKCLGRNTVQKENPKEQCKDRSKLLSKEEFKRIIGKEKLTEIVQAQDPLKSENVYLKKIWDFFQENDTPFDIANMSVIIADDDINIKEPLDLIPDYIPVAHEVVVEDTTLNNKYDSIPEETPTVSEDNSCSQDIQVIHVTHRAQICKEPEKQRSSKDLKILNATTVQVAPQHDYDKIDLLEDEINPHVEPISKINISKLTPVKLQDVLILPKTSERKGKKTIKRSPFVLTSAEWKEQENEKIRIKEEKAEGIKKRKEERQKKKEEKEKNTGKKKKPSVKVPEKAQKKKEDLKKFLLSDNFHNIDIGRNLPPNFLGSEDNQIETEKENEQIVTNNIDVSNIGRRGKKKREYTTEEIERFLSEFEE